MAQTNLHQFCKNQGIDVADLVTETLHYGHTADDGRNIFYHGSKKGIVGDIAPISRAECDFGQGFYMGTATLQPLTLVCAEGIALADEVVKQYRREGRFFDEILGGI